MEIPVLRRSTRERVPPAYAPLGVYGSIRPVEPGWMPSGPAYERLLAAQQAEDEAKRRPRPISSAPSVTKTRKKRTFQK